MYPIETEIPICKPQGIRGYSKWIDCELAKLIKLHDRKHRLPIETKSINKFWNE